MPLSRDNPIELVDSGINVKPLIADLLDHDELWNQHKTRTAVDGPHREIDDIWVRCLDWTVMQADLTAFNRPHISDWYLDIEPMRNAALDIFDQVDGDELGGVLITRIPAGKQVYPHIDQGWHARHYEKYALQIAAHPAQAFCFEAKTLNTRAGDLFTFDNSFTHWVTNQSPVERITMIICVKHQETPCRGA